MQQTKKGQLTGVALWQVYQATTVSWPISEKIAEAGLPYVFRLAFTASLNNIYYFNLLIYMRPYIKMNKNAGTTESPHNVQLNTGAGLWPSWVIQAVIAWVSPPGWWWRVVGAGWRWRRWFIDLSSSSLTQGKQGPACEVGDMLQDRFCLEHYYIFATAIIDYWLLTYLPVQTPGPTAVSFHYWLTPPVEPPGSGRLYWSWTESQKQQGQMSGREVGSCWNQKNYEEWNYFFLRQKIVNFLLLNFPFIP